MKRTVIHSIQFCLFFISFTMSGQNARTSNSDHEAVDLGLSVKWATCNIGATSPEKSGQYFSWGETKAKNAYANTNYQEGKAVAIGDVSGSNHDVATAEWGANWRTPNLEEAHELVDKCKWEWQTINGQGGYKITGPNGNSIFLPAVGYAQDNLVKEKGKLGFYWTSTRKIADTANAFTINFMNDPSYEVNQAVHNYQRFLGLVIRPVSGIGEQADDSFLTKSSGNHNNHDYVDLGLSVKWATCNVDAESPEEYGGYYARGDSRMNKSVFTEGNYKHYDKILNNEVKELSGSKYDVATLRWGGNWRTPTEEEAKELMERCKWEPVRIRGHYGYKVTGPNGNSIFLPAAGEGAGYSGSAGSEYPNKSQESTGEYWTTGIGYFDGRVSSRGKALSFISTNNEKAITTKQGEQGLTIRPVL